MPFANDGLAMSADILHFVPVTEAPNRIRELRMQAELSQELLGEAIGVSKVTISELERGKMALTLDYMQRIAEALEVYPSDLLPHSDSPEPLSVAERALIEQLRAASPEQREQLHRVADVIAPYRVEQSKAERLRAKKSA